MLFHPSYNLTGASPLPLDKGGGVSFFGQIQHSPVDGCSAASCYFGVLIKDKCPHPSTPHLASTELVFCILLFSSICCNDHWRRLSYLSLLFFGTPHSNGYIFPFLLCFSFLLFSAICRAFLDNHFAFFHFFFLGDGLDHCLVQYHEPPP